MDLSHTFTVNLPVKETWAVLTDLERVAPCLPGAALLGVDGDLYRGAVKIKVGPITAQYQGTAQFVDKDDDAHRAVIRAEGKDVGGQGQAAATVSATLSEQGSGTKVDLRTDLNLSGRVAQFGRGVIADVTSKLIGQFVQRLEAEVAGGDSADGDRHAVNIDDVEPLDVMSNMRATLALRALPIVGAVAAVIAGIMLGRRGRRRTRSALAGAPAMQTLPGSIVINLALPGSGRGADVTEVYRR